MAKQSVRLEGLSELLDALEELPKATGTNVIKRTLTKAAEPFENMAKALAPFKTGQLRRSIVIKPGSARSLSRNQAANYKKESKVEVMIGAGALPHAHLLEFGTVKMRARPFLRPAWDANKMEALKSIRDLLAAEIEKARQRLARKAERLAAKIRQQQGR